MSAANLDIPLAELIRALRGELVAAVREGADEDVRFALGPVELELEVAVTREAGGEAGIAFWVLTIGGKGSRSQATTQHIKLTLTPVGPGGEDIVIRSDVPARPD